MMVARPDADALAVQIIPMKRRHVRSVTRIEQQVYPRPWSSSLFLSELALRANRSYIVAKVGRDVVGYGGLMLTGEEGHITTLAVDPRWQRHQIGTRLLLALVREAADRGVNALTLEVRLTNEGARELYRRFGFVPVGVRKNYYTEIQEDALIMWARDIATGDYHDTLARIEATIDGETVIETRRRT
jgi:[ribosomal protein S18]-alanine N-acetyltransferase